MKIVVRQDGAKREIEAAAGATLLEALRDAGMPIEAPCGGNGTCKKCRVLVRDDAGVSYRLACQTPVRAGMEVTLQKNRAMEVSTAGVGRRWEPDAGVGYGVAVDVGTTTVVCRLYDRATGALLASAGNSNAQIVFGADVITRIKAADDGRLEEMRSLIADEVESLIATLCQQVGVRRADVGEIVLAGNTTMEHIAAGLDPHGIGVAPFSPVTLFGKREPFLGGSAYFAPCVSGYVGGDITCGLLAVDVLAERGPVLFVDLGTNGEMALGDASGIVSCATAAGPVFEGSNVRFGMPAYPGAISGVRYEDGRVRLQVIGGEDPVGICGTGLIDAVALLLDVGIVDETGRMLGADEVALADDGAQEGGGVPSDGGCLWALADRIFELDGRPAFRLAGDIAVTQEDVRNLQLAKAAVAGGIETLLARRGIGAGDVAKLQIAGGFGQFLDMRNAARVGLFPTVLLDRATSVGNTSIEGASAVLLSATARAELRRIVERCSYIELSGDPTFDECYLDAMEFE